MCLPIVLHRSAVPQVDDSPFIDAAAQCRDRADTVWCLQQLGRPWDESAFSTAVSWHSVELVEWMGAHGCPMPVSGMSRSYKERSEAGAMVSTSG